MYGLFITEILDIPRGRMEDSSIDDVEKTVQTCCKNKRQKKKERKRKREINRVPISHKPQKLYKNSLAQIYSILQKT